MKSITITEDSSIKSLNTNLEVYIDELGGAHILDNDLGAVVLDIEGEVEFKECGNLLLIEQKDKAKLLTVYDNDNKRVLADKWRVLHYDTGVYLLKDNTDEEKTCHILDTNRFKEAMFNETYYGCGMMSKIDSEPVIKVGGNDGVEAYTSTRGFIFPDKHKDIQVVGSALTYRDGENWILVGMPRGKKKPLGIINRKYDKIWADKENENVVYCRWRNVTHAYYVHNGVCIHLFSDNFLTDVQITEMDKRPKGNIYDCVFQFTEREFKNGLIRVNLDLSKNTSSNICLISPAKHYNIEKNVYGHYITTSANRVGLIRTSNPFRVVEPEYDHITALNKRFYLLEDNGLCDLYDIEKDRKVLTEFEVQSESKDAIVFKRLDGEEGIISFTQEKDQVDVQLLRYCTSVQDTMTGYYYISKNWYMGVSRLADEIIPCEYDTIQLERFAGPDTKSELERTVYFTCTNMDKSTELIKYNRENGREDISTRKFRNYRFYEDFLLMGDREHLYVYNLEHELLLTLPITEDVSVAKYKDGKPYIYRCGDKLYKLNQDGLKRLDQVKEDIAYTKVYETEYGYVVLNESDKESFDLNVRWLDAVGYEGIVDALKQNYEESPSLKMRYPGLGDK